MSSLSAPKYNEVAGIHVFLNYMKTNAPINLKQAGGGGGAGHEVGI